MSRLLHRRPLRLELARPIVSFTFDDAPSSAFETGGRILEDHGGTGTYYICMGLMDQITEIAQIGGAQCYERALAAGHELGCHTYDHLDAWHVPRAEYLASIDRNAEAVGKLFPGHRFESFAYPKSGAIAAVKPELSHRFTSCRGGGQGINRGQIDLNLLNACFLDERAGVTLEQARALIDDNARSPSWLIFAAHDIADQGSIFRTAPGKFEAIVKAASLSGAELLTVREAYGRLSL